MSDFSPGGLPDDGRVYPTAAELLDDAPQKGVPYTRKTQVKGSQVGGTHYDDMKISPLEYIEANCLDFATGSVVKYISRYKNKDGLADLLKARHYVEVLIERWRKEHA